MTPTADFHDTAGQTAADRNRQIQLRLDAWHGKNYGGSMRPDAAKHLLGRRAMLDVGGQLKYRYVVDPSVPDNDPRADLADLELWTSWQLNGSNSLPFKDPNTGEKGWRKIPSRWQPIYDYVFRTLQELWTNARFLTLDEGTLDNEFAACLKWALKHITPAQPPKEINQKALLRHISEATKTAGA